MPKTARAHSRSSIRIGNDVENDVIGTGRIAAHSANTGHVVQSQIVSYSPRDEMICAGCVAAKPYGSEQLLSGTIKCESAAENIHASNLFAD